MSNRSGSVESVRSAKSDVSHISKVSQKARAIGLQAEIDVLQKEGIREITEQAKAMKDAANRFEEEQKSVLAAEIAAKKQQLSNAILDHDELAVDEGNVDNKMGEVVAEMRCTVDNLRRVERNKEQGITHIKDREKYASHKDNAVTSKHSSNSISFDATTHMADLSNAMVQMMKRQAAPEVEIDSFSGDALEYSYFISTFKDMVETVLDDPRARLNRLLKFTTGDAKDLIKHCVHNDPNSCYNDAMSLLEREYGDPIRIASAYVEKLKNWSMIKHGDGASVKSLYRFLLQCQAYQKRGCLLGLDSPLTIRSIQLKLPLGLQDKWTHLVGKVRKRKKREADFDDFVEFIETESAALNDPVYSRTGSNDDKISNNDKKDNEREKVKTLATATLPEKEKVHESAPKNDSCLICQAEHDLDECPMFLAKMLKDRKQFCFDNRLCFGCLSSGHVSRNCENRKTCKVCSKRHPSSLHVYKTLATGGRNAEDGAGMCVVPVKLRHSRCKEQVLIVYAILDECSQGTFISEDVLMQFEYLDRERDEITADTLIGVKTLAAFRASGFVVSSIDSHDGDGEEITLPCLFSRERLPLDKCDIPSKEYVKSWSHLKHIADSFLDNKDAPIGLLIGRNCRKALEPVEIIPSQNNGPYATRTRLGWSLGCEDTDDFTPQRAVASDIVKVNFNQIRWPANNVITGYPSSISYSIKGHIRDESERRFIKEVWNEEDTHEINSEQRGLSCEDQQFLEIMSNNIKFVDGHYELPLPFRDTTPNLSFNRESALKRADGIKRKMLKNNAFHKEYVNFMKNLLDSGYARRVKDQDLVDKTGWYLPHHAVYHPTKGKMRVVFDCSAEYKGVSLNSSLLQGPDLTNLLTGVFLRFRREEIAILGDIECMYYQVRVPELQRKYLRFVFWPDGNLETDPVDYEMNVHVFGAVSSMGCVNYALHQTAKDNENCFGYKAANTLINEFYVDDMATSVCSTNEAINLIENVDGMCKAGGFSLTKIVCNDPNVMELVPYQKRSETFKNCYVTSSPILERPLGVLWTIKNDQLGFRITFQSGPVSRRGMMKTIHSIYDLLGIGAPFLLKGRKTLQGVTGEKASWDDNVGSHHVKAWNKWKDELLLLQELTFPRCYKPAQFGEVVETSLHVFGDGSDIGYGAACYLRQVNINGEVAVALVMGKSKVSPLKPISVPRLELTASLLAVKLGAMVSEELKLKDVKKRYYTDSKIVLGYIFNDTKRFRVYVGNRKQKIRSYSSKEEWVYVDTKENPADDASRGLSMKQVDKVQRWLGGPGFLRNQVSGLGITDEFPIVSDDDPEVVKAVNTCIIPPTSIIETIEKRISRWSRMRRVMAMVILFIKKLRKVENLSEPDKLSVEDLQEAELNIIKLIQQRELKNEHMELKAAGDKILSKPKKNSQLYKLWKLSPFIDNQDVLRVGGRIRNSVDIEFSAKFPVILPKMSIISQRIVEHYHKHIHHGGRTSTTNEIRSNGYWIIGMSTKVRSVIYHCVKCRAIRGATGVQKMADLPADRMNCEAPFTCCGVDMFGPFFVKEGRKELKRYCALFTCLSSRAVHIEVTTSMDTDSFIQALRRFVARRGPVRLMRSDNGGNFIGAENELKEAWKKMDRGKVVSFLSENNCDWVEWKRNTPEASHMGGVWERQIGTVKRVLSGILHSPMKHLDNEAFCTLITEVEAIVNSRPLTLENINDPESMPLTPNHLLTMKSKVVMTPPGIFQKADVYCRKRWRAVQHLANTFWDRWRKEYLLTLQSRQKWTTEKRNFQTGDVILLKDEQASRNSWPMGIVSETFSGKDDLVRSVNVRLASGSVLKRPITKLVLLVEARSEEISDKDCRKSDDETSSRGECDRS